MIPGQRDQLTFFDKVIHVTFYKWVSDPTTKTAILESAFTIRSDRPGATFNYFESVYPPDKDQAEMRYGIAKDFPGLPAAATPAVDAITSPFQGLTNYGPKPNIRLQMQQLPETVCTNITLTIENLTTEVDISEYSAMYIEAGYAYSHNAVPLTAKFYAAIFTSYIESPNPNGRTVFTGVVGNWFVKGLRAQPYTLSVAPGTYTLKNYIDIICSYLGVYPQITLPNRLLNYPLTWNEATSANMRAQSGYQVIDWLSREITAMTSVWRNTKYGEGFLINKDDMVATYFYDNYLFVSLVGEAEPGAREKMAVNLNKITAASFTGGFLSVTAPWNPMLIPGKLFLMDSTFFRGRMLPTVALSSLKDRLGLYRPITIDIMFETASNVNQMKVQAVAALIVEDENAQVDEPTEFEILQSGIMVPITLDKAQAAERQTTAEMQEGAQAAYYSGSPQADEYAIGILAGQGEAIKAEVDRRKAAAIAVNASGSVLINKDIVIVIDPDAISAWDKLMSSDDVQTVTKYEGKEVSQNMAIALKDPSRDSTYYDKVDDTTRVELSLMEYDWGSTYLDKTMDYLYYENELTPGIQYVYKDRGSGTWIPIILIIRVLGALYTYKEFQKHIDSRNIDPATFKDVWRGNTYCFMPVADSKTNAEVKDLFPPADKDFNYRLFYIPRITSGDELNTLLDTHAEYLQAVYDYWTALATIPPDGEEVAPPDQVFRQVILDLASLLDYHNSWRDTPWKATTGYRMSEDFTYDDMELW